MQPRRLGYWLALLTLGLSAVAQETPSGAVILPQNYDSTKAYPVIFDLDDRLPDRYLQLDVNELDKLAPEKRFEVIQKSMELSTAAPERLLTELLGRAFPGGAQGKEFILVKVSGDGITGDYRTAEGFAKRIEGYERKVLASLAALSGSRRIDPARVFLTGFSIGGDLSWAIALRNPSKIRGAIVMSSRASYRQSSAYSELLKGGARFVFTMGSSDDASRIKGAKDAAALLKGLKIPSLYCEIPKATHQAAPLSVFAEALGFMLTTPTTSAAQAKPANALCKAP